MKQKLVAACLAVIATSTSFAEDCSSLLSQGIYDFRSLSIDLTTASSYSQWFCDKKFSSAQQANDFGASLAFPFKGLPVKLGFDSSSHNYSSWQSSFCASIKQDQSLQSRVRDHIQTINPTIVDAFNQCLKSDGLHVWLERSPDPFVFKFAAYWNPPDSETAPTTKIKTFSFGPNVKCDNRPIKISNSEFRTRCTRTDSKAVIGTLTATPGPIRGGGNLTLPEIAPPPTIIPQPPGPTCTTATDLVTTLYKRLLEREPEAKGLSDNVATLTTKQLNVRQLVDAFIHSPEYQNRFVIGKSDPEIIIDLYKHVLARSEDPRTNDPDGFNHQVAHLSRLGFKQIATNFVYSREYEDKFGNWIAPENPPAKMFCN